MKQILMSIRPEYLVKILNGEKTIEIRKTVPIGFVGWVNLYCTLANPYLVYTDEYIGGRYVEPRWTFLSGYSKEQAYKIFGTWDGDDGIANGLVVARFWFEEHKLTCGWRLRGNTGRLAKRTKGEEEMPNKSCLSIDEIVRYAGGENNGVYGITIKNLEIFDTPKELNEFKRWIRKTIYSGMDCPPYVDDVLVPVTKAPQSWMYVEVVE